MNIFKGLTREQKIELRNIVRSQVPDTDPRYDDLMAALMFRDEFNLADFGFHNGEIEFPEGYEFPGLTSNSDDEMEDG